MLSFFTMFINVILIYVSYKIVNYIYKVLTFDTSEFKNLDSNDNKIVFGIYGHTSYLDVPFFLYLLYKESNINIKILASNKYEYYYPKFICKYIHFINGNTSSIVIDKYLGLFIEGSRKKENFIKSGFKYIAINNNAKIVYGIINFKNNRLELSEKIDNNLSNEILLEKLRYFIKERNPNDYSIYPNSCSTIKFKSE